MTVIPGVASPTPRKQARAGANSGHRDMPLRTGIPDVACRKRYLEGVFCLGLLTKTAVRIVVLNNLSGNEWPSWIFFFSFKRAAKNQAAKEVAGELRTRDYAYRWISLLFIDISLVYSQHSSG